MQVIAQAEVPVETPFTHLGYVSAMWGRENSYYSTYGAFAGFLIAGVVLLLALHRKSLVWKAGIVAVIVTASIALFAFSPQGNYKYPAEVTASWAEDLHSDIVALQKHGRPIPGDIRQLRQMSAVDADSTQDAWGHDFRVDGYSEDGKTDYRVISAGADGKFGTLDDISFPLTKNDIAEEALERISERISEAIVSRGHIPKGVETKPSQWDTECAREDPWGTGYVIRKDKTEFRAICAGPDKRFDTADDIVARYLVDKEDIVSPPGYTPRGFP